MGGVVGFWLVAQVSWWLAKSGVELNMGGCMTSVFMGFMFGSTIGSIVGIVFVDRVILKVGGRNTWIVVGGMALSIIMSYVSLICVSTGNGR